MTPKGLLYGTIDTKEIYYLHWKECLNEENEDKAYPYSAG